MSIPYKGLYAHRSLSTRFGTEFSFQVFYDLALCYRSPLLSVMKLRLLDSILEELIKGLRMLGHCDKYTKIWATLTDHVKEVYFTFLTHLEQDCPVLWESSLGLYYRRVSQVPSDCASFVAIPRNPFKRYKKASCHPRNLDKPILPSVEDDYPLVPSLDYTPSREAWPLP